MMPKCRGPFVFDPGTQLQITILVKKTTPLLKPHEASPTVTPAITVP
jgi:hypothetical protein